jgi:hypothetical protein
MTEKYGRVRKGTEGRRMATFQEESPTPSDLRPDPERRPRKRFGELWQEHVVHGKSFPQVVITFSFVITFAIVRIITHGIRGGWLPFGNLNEGGDHIHHYVWGIGILIVVGFVELAYHPERLRGVLGMFYGVAVALILDEFALLLNLKDVYWTSQGRESIDAVVIAAGLLFLALLLRPFFHEVIKELRR